MSATSLSKYPDGFAGGVNIRGLNVLNTYAGDVYWVDSGTGSDDYTRCTIERPWATIDNAINHCTASNNDIIMVFPGHAETLTAASAITMDTAGVRIIGLGEGALRPTITFGTAIAASMVISAASCTIENVLFVNGKDNLTAPISITGADCTLRNIETRDNNASYHCDDFIVATGNRLTIDGWEHRGGGKAGAQSAGSFNGTDDLKLHNFRIYGEFAVGGIENITDEWLRADIAYGTVENTLNTPVPCIHLDANSTGMIRDVYLRVDSGESALNSRGRMNLYNVTQANADGQFGYDVADHWYYTSKSLHFSADTSLSCFDVTGDVELVVWGECTSAVTSHGDDISLGVSGANSSIMSADGGSAWNGVGFAKSAGAPVLWTVTEMDPKVVLNGENITATATANIAAGDIVMTAKWRPISKDGLLVAA